jgi:hypothetical protein
VALNGTHIGLHEKGYLGTLPNPETAEEEQTRAACTPSRISKQCMYFGPHTDCQQCPRHAKEIDTSNICAIDEASQCGYFFREQVFWRVRHNAHLMFGWLCSPTPDRCRWCRGCACDEPRRPLPRTLEAAFLTLSRTMQARDNIPATLHGQ